MTGHGLLGGNEASLAYKDYLNYLTALLRQKDSIILSGASLASVHASLAENAPEIKKPKKLQHSVAQFLATSADRASNASTLVACLQCIAPIRQSEGINLLLPLIQHILVEGGIEHLYPTADQQQQIVELIITCFEQSRSSCFEHPAAPPLLAMRSIISSETRSSTAAAYRSRILRLMETAFFNKFSMKARYAMLEYIILQGLSLDTVGFFFVLPLSLGLLAFF